MTAQKIVFPLLYNGKIFAGKYQKKIVYKSVKNLEFVSNRIQS